MNPPPLVPPAAGRWWPPCPGCGNRREFMREAAGGEDNPGQAPVAGAFFVCARCGDVSVFDDGPFGLFMRVPTSEELDTLAGEPQAQAVVAQIRRMLDRRFSNLN